MSAAGYLTSSELTPVQGSIQLGNVTAYWWLRFEAQLRAASGIDPILSTPDGGYRTAYTQNAKYDVPPDRSDHCKGIGIDLYNHRVFRNWNERRFLDIAAANGFEFYVARELWHARCVKLTRPASTSSTPLTDHKEKIMARVLKDNNTAPTKYRHAVTDFGFNFDFIVGTSTEQATRVKRKVRLIGLPVVSCSPGEFQAELNDVNANRVDAGLPPIVRPI